jgi:elongation factor P
MQTTALELRKGHLVLYNDRVCTVSDWSIMRNDRRQYVYVTLKDLETGRVQEVKDHGDTKYEVLENERIDLTHSYSDGIEEVFYDKDGNEFRCPGAAAKDALLWPSETYVGHMVGGKLLQLQPPASVVVRVTETAPPIRGGGNSGFKDAILENGIKVRVANLVDVGERIRVDPVTLEFRERVGK